MFLPYGTDAPIYHWPITTVVLIVINTLVFAAKIAAPDQAEAFELAFGDGYHPIQWITCCFLHLNAEHLVGNMIFLWSFGLIVEGKLGWYKTLCIYLGIAAIHGLVVQSLMLSSHGSALGASGVIFAFMAMSLVWAPENQVQCVFLFGWRTFHFDMRVFSLVGLFLLYQVLLAVLASLAMSSSLLHLIGAAIGLPLAAIMVQQRLVDCENWDVFSVWAGRNKMSEQERDEAERQSRQREQEQKRENKREAALEQIREIIAQGQLVMAVKAHQLMQHKLPGWSLPEADLSGLIRALHTQKLWAESIPLMFESISQQPEKATLTRLNLARILLVEQHRPTETLEVLSEVDPASLNAREREFFERLQAKAKQLDSQHAQAVGQVRCT